MRNLIGVVLGSRSDLAALRPAVRVLDEFQVPYEVTVASAHRSPERAAAYARTARERGLKVIVAAAGAAAHLAGVLASHTTLPVVGLPLSGSPLGGVDALYATVQMPPGVPVATVGVDAAANAAFLALRILGSTDPGLAARLEANRQNLAAKVEEQARELAEGGWRR
ncbi:MAG: 5-(carboxyamino)imidazole ribonucleotide mutase [Thermaerobacter sp.]|nr:5-(carboxyamino)imidazole ribonucleotide mutase [Thermaerobacter sp.]